MLVYQDGERDREVSLGGGVRFGECRRHEGAILAPVGCLVGAEQLFSEADGVRQQVSSQGGPPGGTLGHHSSGSGLGVFTRWRLHTGFVRPRSDGALRDPEFPGGGGTFCRPLDLLARLLLSFLQALLKAWRKRQLEERMKRRASYQCPRLRCRGPIEAL